MTANAHQQPLRLSKSRVLSGHRCARKLWLELNERDAPELTALDTARTIVWGNRVGERARTYFPGGVLIEGDPGERIERTREVLAGGARTLFEASFVHKDVYASVDVLRRRGTSFVLTEVKSSTEVKSEHLLDTAVQTWVLRGAGLDVKRVEVMVLNRKCRFPDLSNLFVRHNVTADVNKLLRKVPKIVREVRASVSTTKLPVVTVGEHCSKPYACAFMDRCWAGLPDHHVGELYRISSEKLSTLRELGIETIHELPDDFELSVIAARQRRAVQTGRLIVEEGLGVALSKFKAPLGFLDFETVALPIPLWNGCQPYGKVPVQFSFDLQTPSGLRNSEWIADGPQDPRPAIAAALVEACNGAKTILAYNSGFEKSCIDGLIEAVPSLGKKLTLIRDRIEDLLPVVREHVYHPKFHGSFSIKSVHPALVGRNPYSKLNVADGDAAMTALERLMFDALADTDRTKLKKALLGYCATDTKVMVDVHDKLLREVRHLSGGS